MGVHHQVGEEEVGVQHQVEGEEVGVQYQVVGEEEEEAVDLLRAEEGVEEEEGEEEQHSFHLTEVGEDSQLRLYHQWG